MLQNAKNFKFIASKSALFVINIFAPPKKNFSKDIPHRPQLWTLEIKTVIMPLEREEEIKLVTLKISVTTLKNKEKSKNLFILSHKVT